MERAATDALERTHRIGEPPRGSDRLRPATAVLLFTCVLAALTIWPIALARRLGWFDLLVIVCGAVILYAAARQTPSEFVRRDRLAKLPGAAMLVAAILSQLAGMTLIGGNVAATMQRLFEPIAAQGATGAPVLLAAALAACLLLRETFRPSPLFAVLGALVGARLVLSVDFSVLTRDLTGIIAAWLIAPVAAIGLTLCFISGARFYAARRGPMIGPAAFLPALAAILSGGTVIYLMMDGLSRFAYVTWPQATIGGAVTAGCVWLLMKTQPATAAFGTIANGALPALPLAPILCLWFLAQGANDIAGIAGGVAALAGTASAGSIGLFQLIGLAALAAGLIAARSSVAPLWREAVYEDHAARLSWSLLAASLVGLIASAIGLPVSLIVLTTSAGLAAIGIGEPSRRVQLAAAIAGPLAAFWISAVLGAVLIVLVG